MKEFDIHFKDGGVVTTHEEDMDTLRAELPDWFPNREVDYIEEVKN